MVVKRLNAGYRETALKAQQIRPLVLIAPNSIRTWHHYVLYLRAFTFPLRENILVRVLVSIYTSITERTNTELLSSVLLT